MNDDTMVLTVAEVAKLLRLSKAFTYELVARGELPALHFGRRVLVPRRALEHWLESRVA